MGSSASEAGVPSTLPGCTLRERQCRLEAGRGPRAASCLLACAMHTEGSAQLLCWHASSTRGEHLKCKHMRTAPHLAGTHGQQPIVQAHEEQPTWFRMYVVSGGELSLMRRSRTCTPCLRSGEAGGEESLHECMLWTHLCVVNSALIAPSALRQLLQIAVHQRMQARQCSQACCRGVHAPTLTRSCTGCAAWRPRSAWPAA